MASNESLEVLVSADKADGARGWELHARFAKRISSGEVVLRMDLDGQHPLASLNTGGGSDVLSKGASHALRDTVSTGTGGLLVLTKDVMGEGVDAEGVSLRTGLLTDG